MKCKDCKTEMEQTGERLGMDMFYVCLKCHPEYSGQVKAYKEFEERFWNNHFNSQLNKEQKP